MSVCPSRAWWSGGYVHIPLAATLRIYTKHQLAYAHASQAWVHICPRATPLGDPN